MFLSNAYVAYTSSSAQRAPEDQLWILGDEKGGLNAHMLRGAVKTDLFRHGGASSWHGWDADAIVAIGKLKGRHVALLGLVVMFVVFAVAWLLAGGRARTRTAVEDYELVKLG